eukprot:CFRG4773T1
MTFSYNVNFFRHNTCTQDLANGELIPVVTVPPSIFEPMAPDDVDRTTTPQPSPSPISINCGSNGTPTTNNRGCVCDEGYATDPNQDALNFMYCGVFTGDNPNGGDIGGSEGGGGSVITTENPAASSGVNVTALVLLIFCVLTVLVVCGISCVCCFRVCCRRRYEKRKARRHYLATVSQPLSQSPALNTPIPDTMPIMTKSQPLSQSAQRQYWVDEGDMLNVPTYPIKPPRPEKPIRQEQPIRPEQPLVVDE